MRGHNSQSHVDLDQDRSRSKCLHLFHSTSLFLREHVVKFRYEWLLLFHVNEIEPSRLGRVESEPEYLFISKDDGLIRPLSSSIRPRFYPCTGLHLPHPQSARTHPAAAGALLMSVDSINIHSCIVA